MKAEDAIIIALIILIVIAGGVALIVTLVASALAVYVTVDLLNVSFKLQSFIDKVPK